MLFSMDTARFASSILCMIADPCVCAWFSCASAVTVTLHCSTLPAPWRRPFRSAVVVLALRFLMYTARSARSLGGVLRSGALLDQGLVGWKRGKLSLLESGRGWMGETGYMGIMFQPGGSNMEQCIMGEGGKHCMGWDMGSGIMGMKGWGMGIGPIICP